MIKIPIYKPKITDLVKKYVNECLNSSWISSKGKFIDLFQNKFSDYTNIKYNSTVSNGTVALHLALLALDIKKGDEVIVPSFTYVASVNAIKYVGAIPVFIDSDINTWNLDVDDLKRKITKRTKAIMLVHIYGYPCDMESILKVANNNTLFVIEDCAEALGTFYKGDHVGNFGHISTFSFFGNKTLTTGEGGMVSSNDSRLIKRVSKLKSQSLSSSIEYWHDEIGYNYRMTNICAAIGYAQFNIIEDIIKRKKEIRIKYFRKLNKHLTFQANSSETLISSNWMVSILFQSNEEKNFVRKILTKNGIETRPLFPLVNKMAHFKTKEKFKIESISDRGINLPSFPDLTDDQLSIICEIIISATNDFRTL